MADEFNLVPTNNLEKHLDNILRTAQGEEPQYDLAPNWRTEQYLAAIASALASGGGGGGVDIEFVKFSESGGNVSCDHTVEQIASAIDNGKIIFGLYNGFATGVSVPYKSSTYGTHYQIRFVFTGFGSWGGNSRVVLYTLTMTDESSSITKSMYNAVVTT